MARTVKAPERYAALFERAEELVGIYFAERRESPGEATIDIGGERYLLVRAASVSVEFFGLVESLFSEKSDPEAFAVARNMLFDMAHAMGRADARAFAARMDLQSPAERLSAGPVHFAYTGWASVQIDDESSPTPNEDYVLLYTHPYSFESHAWKQAGKTPPGPICVMNAGYSSGWCEEAFGIALVASEVTCSALGHEECRFVMAPPSRIDERVARYLDQHPELKVARADGAVSGYLENRIAEEALREREAQYRAVFEGVTDALIVIDVDGTVVQANPEAGRLFDRGVADIEGRSIDELLGVEAFATAVAAVLGDGAEYEGRMSLPAGDGTVRHLNLRGTSIHHRGQDRLLIVIGNTTETELARQALQGANVSLEERSRELREANILLTELNEDLVRARDQAVAASRAKSTFLARISHEFRTPLNAVIGYAELMREEHGDGGPPNMEDLGRIIDSAGHLLALINEVLDIAKIEAGEMTVSVETFDIRRFFRSVVDFVRPSAAKARNTLSLHVSTPIRRLCTDQTKLRQIVLNLLSNAVKFTYDGEIRVLVDMLEAGNEDVLRVTVSDTGIGIAAESRAQLFEPFRQADESTTRRYGGTGLGLSISLAFARLMGGDIVLDSIPGQGATFTVTIPVWILPGDRPNSGSTEV